MVGFRGIQSAIQSSGGPFCGTSTASKQAPARPPPAPSALFFAELDPECRLSGARVLRANGSTSPS